MNSWPPKPGSTVITSSVSKSGSTSRYCSSGVPGLSARPASAPAARMSRATAARVGAGLGVHGDVAGAGLGVAGRPALGVLDHEVAVERNGADRLHRLHHRQPERQVRARSARP